jgi:hypothetical protein
MNLVMLFLFAAVAAEPARMMKVIGCGLAAGVAIDAFVLRAALLPALLHLLDPRRSRQNAHGGPDARPVRRPGIPDLARTRTPADPTPDRPAGVGNISDTRTVPIRFSRSGEATHLPAPRPAHLVAVHPEVVRRDGIRSHELG